MTVIATGAITITDSNDILAIRLSATGVSIAATASGVMIAGSYTTTAAVYIGNTLETGWTFSRVDSSGVTSNIGSSTGLLTVTAMTDATSSGYTDITATKTGYSSITARVSIVKINGGAPGGTGPTGPTGITGPIGTRGTRQLYLKSAAYISGYTGFAADATAAIATATAGTTPTTPIIGDTVTFSNLAGTYAYTLTCTATTPTWTAPGTVIDGSLLVTGSVTASAINSNGLSIKDTNGNVILSAGSSLVSQIAANANLVQDPVTWSHSNPNWTNTANNYAESKASLVLPTAVVASSSSPTLNLSGLGGTFTVSFKATTATARELHVDLFPDTLPGSFVTLPVGNSQHTFTWTSAHANLSSCVLRFFAQATAGQIEVYDIKLEVGSTRTRWIPHVNDRIGVNNKINSGNASTYIADLAVNTLQIANQAVTVPVGAKLANDFAKNNQAGTYTVMSVVLDSGGNPIWLTLDYSLYIAPGSMVTIALMLDGVQIMGRTLVGAATFDPTNLIMTSYLPTPASGNRTISMSVTIDSGLFYVYKTATTLFAIGVKK